MAVSYVTLSAVVSSRVVSYAVVSAGGVVYAVVEQCDVVCCGGYHVYQW